MSENFTCDDILYGRLKLLQPLNGPRVNLDTILLSAWVKFRSGHSEFLEAGCATGAVSLLLAMKYRNIHVTGIDIQSDLIELARLNAENNSLSERIDFMTGDLRDKDILPREKFDVVVMNPPYSSVEHGRVSSDITRSTARHELNCTPDDVGEMASRVLKHKGRLFTVFTSARLDVFTAAMTKYDLLPKRIKFVYPDLRSISGIFLAEFVKGGGAGVSILSPLIVRDEKGDYTPEVLNAYELDGHI